jgi:hypothetical protein
MEIFVGSGKGAAMVACVAERNFSGIFIEHDKETADYEKVNKILID